MKPPIRSEEVVALSRRSSQQYQFALQCESESRRAMPREFESFDRENPPDASPPGLPVKAIARFIVPTTVVAVLLLVLTGGSRNVNGVVDESGDMLNAADSSVINPLSFGTMTPYWDQRDPSAGLGQSNARVTGVQASDLELLQIQQVVRHGSRYENCKAVKSSLPTKVTRAALP
jgi:hypothetical protein